MAWIRVESSVARNRKFLEAGSAASWLWLCGLAYCQEGLTDGFIPFQAIDRLGPSGARKLKCRLVAVGLWDEVEGGWQVHDYLEHNRSAADVAAIRAARASGGKRGGRPKDNLQGKPSDTEKVNLTQNPSTSTATETATETATASDTRARMQPIHPKRRLDAAFDGPRGLYVPQSLHQQFVGLRNHPNADFELQVWYEAVANDWSHGAKKHLEPDADMFRFWRAQYAEKWPPTPAVKPTSSRLPAWAQAVQARKDAGEIA